MRFKRVYIEITNQCNLKCSFCPPSVKSPRSMSIMEFSYILDQIRGYTEYLYLHIKGEPLLHPDIDTLLDICHEKEFKVNITTNGTLVPKLKNMLLKKPAIRQMSFSLQSMENMSNQSDSNRYLLDILDFIKEAVKKTDMIIELRLWNLDEGLLNGEKTSNSEEQAINTVTSNNEEHPSGVTSSNKEILSSHDVLSSEGIISNEDITTNRVMADHKVMPKSEDNKNTYILNTIEQELKLTQPIIERINKEKGTKLTERIYLSQSYEFEWPDINRVVINDKGYCYGLKHQIGILSDGTVVPCCLDSEGIINLGNIFETTFTDILAIERTRNIIEGFKERKVVEPLCQRCGYRQRFSGTKF